MNRSDSSLVVTISLGAVGLLIAGTLTFTGCSSGTPEASPQEVTQSRADAQGGSVAMSEAREPAGASESRRLAEKQLAQAQAQDTIEAYNQLLDQDLPDDLARIARHRVVELEFGQAVESGRYGSVAAFVSEHPDLASDSPIGASLEQELARFREETVGRQGRVIWKAEKSSARQKLDCVVEVAGSVRDFSALSEIPLTTQRLTADSAGRKRVRAGFEFKLARLDQAIARRTDKWYRPWYLFADLAGDRIELTEGQIQIRPQVKTSGLVQGRYSGWQEIATDLLDPLAVQRMVSEVEAFAASRPSPFVDHHSSEHHVVLCETVLVVYPKPDSPHLGLAGLTQLVLYDKAKEQLQTTYVETPRVNAVILGRVRFPEDRWTQIGEGVEVIGGGMLFDNDRVMLMPGTRIVRRVGDQGTP